MLISTTEDNILKDQSITAQILLNKAKDENLEEILDAVFFNFFSYYHLTSGILIILIFQILSLAENIYFTESQSKNFQSVTSFLKSYSTELSMEQEIRLEMLLETQEREKGWLRYHRKIF